MNNKELVELAKKALENSYAPYSNFNVGASLLTSCGKVFTGCNIENISYSATICAERTAIFNGVSQGYLSFEKLAVVSRSNKEFVSEKNNIFQDFSLGFTYPCGICMQVILEFMPKGKIVLSNDIGHIKELTVSELMPYGFIKS